MATDRNTENDLIPPPPFQTRVYPIFTIGGLLMVFSALAVMAVLATVAHGVFQHTIATELDMAETGTSLLARQGDLGTFPLWVQPFKFLGIAFLLAGIIFIFWGVIRIIAMRGAAMRDSIPVLLKRAGRPEQAQ